MSGFCRRPVWADERTPKVVAVNVWRAKQSYISQAGRSGITERRSRKFVHDWKLTMHGHKSRLAESPNTDKFEKSIKQRSEKPKRTEGESRLEGKRKAQGDSGVIGSKSRAPNTTSEEDKGEETLRLEVSISMERSAGRSTEQNSRNPDRQKKKGLRG